MTLNYSAFHGLGFELSFGLAKQGEMSSCEMIGSNKMWRSQVNPTTKLWWENHVKGINREEIVGSPPGLPGVGLPLILCVREEQTVGMESWSPWGNSIGHVGLGYPEVGPGVHDVIVCWEAFCLCYCWRGWEFWAAVIDECKTEWSWSFSSKSKMLFIFWVDVDSSVLICIEDSLNFLLGSCTTRAVNTWVLCRFTMF